MQALFGGLSGITAPDVQLPIHHARPTEMKTGCDN